MRSASSVASVALCFHLAHGFVLPAAKTRSSIAPCRLEIDRHSEELRHDARPASLSRSSLLKSAGEAAVLAAAGGAGEINLNLRRWVFAFCIDVVEILCQADRADQI